MIAPTLLVDGSTKLDLGSRTLTCNVLADRA